jgi:acyl-CoA thioesterase
MNDFDRLTREAFRANPFHELLGIELDERGPGFARVRLPAAERLRGGVAGSLHGGVLSALADIACLAAMQGVFDGRSRPAGTAELNISYLRPALGAYVLAEARVLKTGRTLAVVDVDMSDPDGRLVAKSRVSYALRPAELPERRA